MARRPKQTDAEIIKEAKDRFARCVAWESYARANALLDSIFANGDAINQGQWDAAVLARRVNKPCLTMNKTRQHILQIVNDARQHKAQIKVTPVGGRATYDAAQVFSGIVRRIEYQSKAVDAYSTAIYHQVETGIGYVRVVTDYADEDSFDQDIFIKRIGNPNTIYLDPDAQEYDKGDMRFGFVFNDIPRDLWEAEHGDEMPAPAAFDNVGDTWNTADHVREAEYWRRGETNDKLHLMADGSTVRESQMPDDDQMLRGMIVKSRDVSVPEVEWFKVVGNKIIERGAWAGKYIPIVPFIGEEVVILNRMDRKGHTRALIDAQRMYNYWNSAAVEQVALQGKAPYITSLRAIEGSKEYWDTANTENHPYLPYNDIDDAGQPIAPPARSTPPVMAQAYIEGMQIAREDMMMVSGQYQANVGAPSNEISGTAINARQRQGENATYHYIDNQAKGIRQIGRIVVDLIPHVYDVARVTKMLGEDNTENDVHVVPNAPEAHQFVGMTDQGPQTLTPQQADEMTEDKDRPNPQIIFNPNVGRYDVEADVGPSYGTQRQEAANAFGHIMAQNPAAFQLIGDFWAQNSDFPGADELAERLRKGLPPQYKAGAPDPQLVQVTQQAHELLGKADAEIADLKQQLATAQMAAKDKGAETTIKDYQAETDRLKAVAAADPVAAQVVIRSMLSEMLGMPALPVMHEHMAADAEHMQAIAPPEPAQAAGNGVTANG